jgi:hypothetical protein
MDEEGAEVAGSDASSEVEIASGVLLAAGEITEPQEVVSPGDSIHPILVEGRNEYAGDEHTIGAELGLGADRSGAV